MSIKKRSVIYQCTVDGVLGEVIVTSKSGKPKIAGSICGLIRMDGTCGAHGNAKCEHKRPQEDLTND